MPAAVPSHEEFGGVIRAIHGTNPGPASGISYKILVNFPDGGREVDGIKPAVDRWPDQIMVRAIAVGTFVKVASVHGILQLMARELPHFAPCGQSLTGPGGSSSLDQLLIDIARATPQQKGQLAAVLKGVL